MTTKKPRLGGILGGLVLVLVGIAFTMTGSVPFWGAAIIAGGMACVALAFLARPVR